MDINKKNGSSKKEHLYKLKEKKNKLTSKVSSLKEHTSNKNKIKENFKNKINIKKNKETEQAAFFLDFGATVDSQKKEQEAKEEKTKKNTNNKINIKLPSSDALSSFKSNYISLISITLVFNILFSVISFNISNNTKFNAMTEQFTNIISRSIKSPQTEIYLRSKYDEKNNSIVYYYEVIDKLDYYTYKIKNIDVEQDLRVKLLEAIASKTKEIATLNKMNSSEYNSITLVEDYYILNNKYRIYEKNISGKDIKNITEHIKINNINNFNKTQIQFITCTFTTLVIIEAFLYLNLKNLKNTNNKKQYKKDVI